MKVSSRSIKYCATGVLALVVVACIFARIRDARRPLSDRASDLVGALARGDAGSLMSYSTDREQAEGKLTKQKLQQVMDRLLVPYLTSKRANSAVQTQEDTGDIHGMAVASFYALNDQPTDVSWEVFLMEDGPKCPVLQEVLTNSWRIRFAHHDGKDLPRGEIFRATLAGLKADGDFLRSLDLPGIMAIDPAKGLASWDAVREHCTKYALR